MPGRQAACLILPDDQKQLGPWVFSLQFGQGIDGVSWAATGGLTGIDHYALNASEGQPRHRHPVLNIRKNARLVPGLARGQNTQLVELQLLQCGLRQSNVTQVRWIERATEHTDAACTLE